MEAELARLNGRVELALRLYEQAMDAAHASEFRRDEAMANELAARHLLGAGRRKAAEGYLRAAWHLYDQWGARRKVKQLEEEFPQLLQSLTARVSGSPGGTERFTPTSQAVELASLDLASVMKASQAISSEIVLERLWTTTMRIMLENAGGQRGCFVVRRDGRLVIEGQSEVGSEMSSSARSVSVDGADGAVLLPISIIYHVLHTKTSVVLHDAAQPGVFAKDAYLLARKPQSVLCIPLVRQGKFEGAIYMENSLAAGVFTEDRIEVIKLLAAQVSIAIENAKLYEDQLHLIKAQRLFVPLQFLESLDHHDIAHVVLGEHVAKTMSVMFADLRGFTPLAERLEPRAVIELLNRYFVSVERPISESGGFIELIRGRRDQGTLLQFRLRRPRRYCDVPRPRGVRTDALSRLANRSCAWGLAPAVGPWFSAPWAGPTGSNAPSSAIPSTWLPVSNNSPKSTTADSSSANTRSRVSQRRRNLGFAESIASQLRVKMWPWKSMR